MKKFTTRFTTCIVAVLTVSMGTTVEAGAITGFTWFSGVTSVAATTFPALIDLDLGDQAGDSTNELFVTQKDYTGIGPVDIVFDVVDNGGVTEYRVREGVNNSTGVSWSSYHIELGTGTGAGFVKSTGGDGLDFDFPGFDSPVNFNPAPGFFPSSPPAEVDILATGGLMEDTEFAGYFIFHLDVPDGISQFTLRQSPVPVSDGGHGEVPEPSTFALAALGLMSLNSVVRRRRRRTGPSARNLALVLSCVGVLGAGALSSQAHAISVSTTQVTAPSGTEAVWGQGVTINVGADVADVLIPATMGLDFVGFRIGDPAVGSAVRDAVYLHVYDGFGVTAGGAIDGSAIGGLISVSVNTQDLDDPLSDGTDVIWTFSQPALAKGSTYYYIMADDTVAATSGDFTNLINSSLEVATTNPYAGGRNYRVTDDVATSDVYFRVLSSSLPEKGGVPEPSSSALVLLGLLFGSMCRRRKRSANSP